MKLGMDVGHEREPHPPELPQVPVVREGDLGTAHAERMKVGFAQRLGVGELHTAHVSNRAGWRELSREVAEVLIEYGQGHGPVQERLLGPSRAWIPGREAEAGEVEHCGHPRCVRLANERVVRLEQDIREWQRCAEVGKDAAHETPTIMMGPCGLRVGRLQL
jgi:hypothetical protein